MNVQPYQLIFALIYMGFVVGLFKIKNRKIRILIVILGLVLFFISPLRFKQKGGTNIEKNVNRFKALSNKVVVKHNDFRQRQLDEMDELKQQSEDLKDEIHD